MQSIIVTSTQLTNEFIKFEPEQENLSHMNWAEIEKIVVETNDQGPFLEDVYFVLITTNMEIKIPQSDSNVERILGRLQDFDGFDNEIFIDAMSCAENKRFICWEK